MALSNSFLYVLPEGKRDGFVTRLCSYFLKKPVLYPPSSSKKHQPIGLAQVFMYIPVFLCQGIPDDLMVI